MKAVVADHKAVRILERGAVSAEWGPMRLVIAASVGKVPQPEMCVRAAEESFTYLQRIARLREVLSKRREAVPKDLEDTLGRSMVESVIRVGDPDLTPMAAVAGTIADAVADFLFDRGMTRVVVNNGGDVAIRLRGGDSVRVGIRRAVAEQTVSDVILLNSLRTSWGVATSGLGGRSFTRGIASAATVIAHAGCVADAAATAVANACLVKDEGIERRPAEELDPNTDLRRIPVTVRVAPLSGEKKAAALGRAMEKAKTLEERGIILGAFIAVQGQSAMTDSFRETLSETAAGGYAEAER
jgi:ApbE superfamily uncharacterized protein (UPF0280 family)